MGKLAQLPPLASVAFQRATPLPPRIPVSSQRCPPHLPAASLNLPHAHRVSDARLSRRAALHALSISIALPLLPDLAGARRTPKEPLASSLVPLVRVRDALQDLSADVSAGTNGDVKRVVKVLLAGSDVMGSARNCALWLGEQEAEEVQKHTREAFEYLNQVVDYFDATATRERPRSEVLKFCQMAIDAAGKELDDVLAFFDQTQVQQARDVLAGPVA